MGRGIGVEQGLSVANSALMLVTTVGALTGGAVVAKAAHNRIQQSKMQAALDDWTERQRAGEGIARSSVGVGCCNGPQSVGVSRSWSGCCKVGYPANADCSELVTVLAADGETLARFNGELLDYDDQAHAENAQEFVGCPLVLNHSAKEVGVIEKAWTDRTNVLYLEVRVCYKYAEQLKRSSLSIATIPTRIEGGNIMDYDAVHLAMLTDGSEPGSKRAGTVLGV